MHENNIKNSKVLTCIVAPVVGACVFVLVLYTCVIQNSISQKIDAMGQNLDLISQHLDESSKTLNSISEKLDILSEKIILMEERSRENESLVAEYQNKAWMPNIEEIYNCIVGIPTMSTASKELIRRSWDNGNFQYNLYMRLDTTVNSLNVIKLEYVINHGETLFADLVYSSSSNSWEVTNWSIK